MNVLFCGDVVGRPGRDAVKRHLPSLRRELALDLVVVNAENAAGGFGLTERLCGELYDCGVDILTTGNHVWDQRQIIPYIDRDPCLLRPANFPKGTPGAGWRVHSVGGQSVLVINLMGRLFMDALDDPFARLDEILGEYRLGEDVAAILVDFHAEASSEKMALGHFADGRVSAVFGTHCHVPTADPQILPGGTAYQTDAGMTVKDTDLLLEFLRSPQIIGIEKCHKISQGRTQTEIPGRRRARVGLCRGRPGRPARC